MATDDIPPTTLKSAPVTAAWEILTAAVPVLLRVRVCGLVDPVATFPKLRVVALAASVPVDPEVEFDLDAGVAAPVKPTQPDSDRAAAKAKIKASKPSGARRFRVTWEWQPKCVCAFMTRRD